MKQKRGDSDAHLLKCSNTASAWFLGGARHLFEDNAPLVKMQRGASPASVPHMPT